MIAAIKSNNRFVYSYQYASFPTFKLTSNRNKNELNHRMGSKFWDTEDCECKMTRETQVEQEKSFKIKERTSSAPFECSFRAFNFL